MCGRRCSLLSCSWSIRGSVPDPSGRGVLSPGSSAVHERRRKRAAALTARRPCVVVAQREACAHQHRRQPSPPLPRPRPRHATAQGGPSSRRDWEVYVMNADGTGLQQLTDNRGFADTEPSWSPNGRRILFLSDREGNDDIYVMNADGSDKRNMTRSKADEHDAAWIPRANP